MLNSYYAELLDVTDGNDLIVYGYTFRDKNMREAKIHALHVCRQMEIVPLPTVWRISLERHQRLAQDYAIPKLIRLNGESPDNEED